LEEVVKASVMLAQRTIGALIVLEREADVMPRTSEGIVLDARVSKELLFSAFLTEHQNPLHDGAVIIQGETVVAAGCFLPLSNNPTIDKTLGTRHRAALGLSEDTDAAIVVVSEETGIISVAYREQLIRGLDASRLREVLHKIFSYSRSGEDERERLSRLKTWLQNIGRSDDAPVLSEDTKTTDPTEQAAASAASKETQSQPIGKGAHG
ncbi:MAG: diadenylate cyclase, partial [Myxococcota bacterium]